MERTIVLAPRLRANEGSTVEAPSGLDWMQVLDVIFNASVWPSVLTLGGVVVGAYLSHKFTLRSRVQEGNRDRLVEAAMESLRCAHDIRRHFRDLAYYGPRGGGGKIRDGSDPTAEWVAIPKREAREHDRAAAQAIASIDECTDRLRELNVALDVFGPPVLSASFNALPALIMAYMTEAVDGGIMLASSTASAIEDFDKLFEGSISSVRDLLAVRSM